MPVPSPFPASTSAPGHGDVSIRLSPHSPSYSTICAISFQYPLKLISPSLPTPAFTSPSKSVLLFLVTYGGGLLPGDHIRLDVQLAPGTKLTILTQGQTKIFKSTPSSHPSPVPTSSLTRTHPTISNASSQTLLVTISAGAALAILPDPVCPFAKSRYQQSQIFTIHKESSLCVLDWVLCGRSARGEVWELASWKGRNEVWVGISPEDAQCYDQWRGGEQSNSCKGDGVGFRRGDELKKRLLLRDNIVLENFDDKLVQKMQGKNIFGTLILYGAAISSLAAFFLEEFEAMPRIGGKGGFDTLSESGPSEYVGRGDDEESRKQRGRERWRTSRLEMEKREGILWSVAKVRGGCTVVKFAAQAVERGRAWIGGMIGEEGSVRDIFGEEALMCLR